MRAPRIRRHVRPLVAGVLAGQAMLGAQPAPVDADGLVAALADPALRQRTAARIEALGIRERIAVLRRGLIHDDAATARWCAARLEWQHLDHAESARLVAVLRPVLGGEASADWFETFREVIGSREIHALLADWPAGMNDWRHQNILGAIHRQLRVAHVPALCALAESENAALGEAALRILGNSMISFTDRHRVAIARAYLERVGAAVRVVERGGWPAALAAGIEQCLLVPASTREGEWPRWFWRWARQSSAGAGDAPLLHRLAAHDGALANAAAACGFAQLDDAESLAALRALHARVVERGDEELASYTLSRLAVRGDARAVDELADRARGSALAIGLLLRVDAARGKRAFAEMLTGEDEDAFEVALVAPGDGALELWGAALDPALVGDARTALALEPALGGVRLARVLAEVPACRTSGLARRAAVDPELRGSDDFAIAAGELDRFVAYLERCSAALAADLLRAWAASDDADTARHGARLLVRLARAEDADVALDAARKTRLQPEDLRLLGTIDAVEIERWLRDEVARGHDDAAVDAALLEALAIRYGMPAEVEWAGAALARVTDAVALRRLVLARRPREALAMLLDAARDDLSTPPPAIANLGLVDVPRVREYLRRLQRQREHGMYAWATGELALAGDAAARAEILAVFREGRYRWVDNSSPRVRTFGRVADDLPFWIDELESNCCRAVVAQAVWERALGFELDGAFAPPVGLARAWWARYGDRLGWSRIARAWVPR